MIFHQTVNGYLSKFCVLIMFIENTVHLQQCCIIRILVGVLNFHAGNFNTFDFRALWSATTQLKQLNHHILNINCNVCL